MRKTPRPFQNSSTMGAWTTAENSSERMSNSIVRPMSTRSVRPTAATAPQAMANATRRLGSGSHRSIMRTPRKTIVSGINARTSPITEAVGPSAQPK